MKNELIQLAKEKGFSSNIISEEPWKYSANEELRWLFWMAALQKWLREVHNIDVISISQSGVITEKYYYYLILVNGKETNKFDSQERFGNILEKSSQDILRNHVNDELLNKYLFEDGFAFITYEASLEAGLYNALQLIK